MANQTETLEILEKERAYEDTIVLRLTDYFTKGLDSINGITPKERQKIKEVLGVIIGESKQHSHAFGNLASQVMKHGEDSY